MATISKVKIVNMALSHLGDRSSVESLSENSAQAKEADLWYDYSRLATLEAFNWNFARKRLTLAEHGDDAPEGVWTFRYQYPSDCVIARYLVSPIGPEGDDVPFEVEGSEDGTNKTIVTDLEDAILVYTRDVEQTSLFTPHFVLTLSYHLAHQMAMALTGKLTVKEAAMQQWLQALARAPAFNANEDHPRKPREAEWIRGRA